MEMHGVFFEVAKFVNVIQMSYRLQRVHDDISTACVPITGKVKVNLSLCLTN
jgi:hypothetical protein